MSDKSRGAAEAGEMTKPSNDWRKRGRSRFTRLSMLKRDIRSAATRSKKKGVVVTLATLGDDRIKHDGHSAGKTKV